jgi:hypothetical protein
LLQIKRWRALKHGFVLLVAPAETAEPMRTVCSNLNKGDAIEKPTSSHAAPGCLRWSQLCPPADKIKPEPLARFSAQLSAARYRPTQTIEQRAG